MIFRRLLRWLFGRINRVLLLIGPSLGELPEHCQWDVIFCDILERPVRTRVGAVQCALLFCHKCFPTPLAPEGMSKVDVNVETIRLVSFKCTVRAPEHRTFVGGGILGTFPQTNTTGLAVPYAPHFVDLNFLLCLPWPSSLVGTIIVHRVRRWGWCH